MTGSDEPRLPPGYRLDRSDSDVWVLRRPEGWDPFKQLVEEGYISVSSMQRIDELPWIVAFPQALTTKGLVEISELPDANARLLGSLNAIEDAIGRLNVDDKQKTTAMKAAEELRGFLQQLPQESL